MINNMFWEVAQFKHDLYQIYIHRDILTKKHKKLLTNILNRIYDNLPHNVKINIFNTFHAYEVFQLYNSIRRS